MKRTFLKNLNLEQIITLFLPLIWTNSPLTSSKIPCWEFDSYFLIGCARIVPEYLLHPQNLLGGATCV